MDGTSLLQTLGHMAASMRAAPAGVPGRIWDELSPWLSRLAVHAGPKWLPRMSFQFPCAVPLYTAAGQYKGPCPRASVAACDCCGRTTCLDHARVDCFGNAICFLCVHEAIEAKRRGAPPPGRSPPDDKALRKARRTLGVDEADEWQQVERAYKRLLATWHPDRFANRSKRERERAEKKFKDIRSAFDLLQQEHERRKAAA